MGKIFNVIADWNLCRRNAIILELMVRILHCFVQALVEDILDTLAPKIRIDGQGRHEASPITNFYLIMISYPNPLRLTERVIVRVKMGASRSDTERKCIPLDIR